MPGKLAGYLFELPGSRLIRPLASRSQVVHFTREDRACAPIERASGSTAVGARGPGNREGDQDAKAGELARPF